MNQRGFSLIEALASAAISVITVIGLAYSFGTGRALMDRHGIARAALSQAQLRLETLAVSTDTSQVSIGTHPATPNNFVYQGVNRGTEQWTVSWLDDPADGIGAADSTGTNDLKRVVVAIRWNNQAFADSVLVSRLFRAN
jgi:type II secretory pathway pseudopilin PulG